MSGLEVFGGIASGFAVAGAAAGTAKLVAVALLVTELDKKQDQLLSSTKENEPIEAEAPNILPLNDEDDKNGIATAIKPPRPTCKRPPVEVQTQSLAPWLIYLGFCGSIITAKDATRTRYSISLPGVSGFH